ncbi:MAG: extracellular solute-binding protein, partial [Syntrophothermus sp.]
MDQNDAFSRTKNLRRLLTYLLVALIITVVGFILPYSSNIYVRDKVTKIYFADHISDVYQKVIDEFNEKYKGKIEVIPVHLPFEKFTTNERKELLTRYLRTKSDRIDVFSVDQIWVPRFAKWGTPFETIPNPVSPDSLLNTALKSCYYNGRLVAAPLYIDVGLMYYRKDILSSFKDPEKLDSRIRSSLTWDEFIRLSHSLSGNRQKPYYVFQADDYEGLVCNFLELLAAQGKNLYDDGGKLQLNTPEAHKALQLLIDLVHKYKLSPQSVSEFRDHNSELYFIQNDGLFFRGWPSFLRDARRDFGNSDKIASIGLAPLPHFPGFKPVSTLGGWNVMISKFSSKKEESMEFIKFLVSRSVQMKLYQEGQYLPVNVNIYNDSLSLNEQKDLKFFHSLITSGVYRPALENYTKISDVISYFLYLAVKNEISAETA